MRMSLVIFLIAALLLTVSCENTVKRPMNDNIAVETDDDAAAVSDSDTAVPTDDETTPDTDGTPTDTLVPADSDELLTDEEGPDEAAEETPVDDGTPIPDEDTPPLDQCNADGGVCVSDPSCPPNYSPMNSPCAAGICCAPTAVSGLRVDVIHPQPVPGNLLAIPATAPQPGSGGTGTPPITADIVAPLLAIGLIETENGDGCDPYKTDASGFITIVQRGNCTFSQKIQNAADAGAIAIIIYNNAPGPLGMNADGTIPTVGIEQTAGEAILGFTGEHPDIVAAIRP